MGWCPWQRKMIATGGGWKDGVLRIWDTDSGTCVTSANTNSQVLKSQKCKRDISSFCVWISHRSFLMTPIADLFSTMGWEEEVSGHRSRPSWAPHHLLDLGVPVPQPNLPAHRWENPKHNCSPQQSLFNTFSLIGMWQLDSSCSSAIDHWDT